MKTTNPTFTPPPPSGKVPAPEYDTWDAVPWFRRAWMLVFVPAVAIIVLTGEMYLKANKRAKQHSPAEVWRYTRSARAFFVVVSVLFTATTTASLLG